MKAVVPVKEEGKDLDYCEKMNANGYTWITGVVADTKLMTGTVADGLLDFDKQGADKYYMYNESLNAGFDSPKYFAQNWKWYIGRNAAIVQLFKANKDCSLTFSNVLPEGKTNGWTDNCVLNVYIVRGEETKKIATVSNPVTQEDFSGVWYMKAGDVLYFEFGVEHHSRRSGEKFRSALLHDVSSRFFCVRRRKVHLAESRFAAGGER